MPKKTKDGVRAAGNSDFQGFVLKEKLVRASPVIGRGPEENSDPI